MKLFFSVLLFSVTLTAFSQETNKQIYKSDDFKSVIPSHKIVAILPFEVNVTYKRPPKNYDAEQEKKEEVALGINLQSEMFTYLLRKRDNYTVSFQDVDKTNTLLRSIGVFEKINEVTVDSLAKILKVDAVIKCNYAYTKTASEGGAIAKAILFGGLGSKTATGELIMSIKNGSNGDLIWRFSKKMDEGVFSSANQLMERMMRKISRNFPYEK